MHNLQLGGVESGVEFATISQLLGHASRRSFQIPADFRPPVAFAGMEQDNENATDPCRARGLGGSHGASAMYGTAPIVA